MNFSETKLRGWVDIYPTAAPAPGFEVYDWSEHHDSGAIVGRFATRKEATAFMHKWAADHSRKMTSADLHSLSDYRKGVKS